MSYKIPSLYNLAVSAICDYYKFFRRDIRMLPETILFDVYITLFHQDKLCALGLEFSDLDVFTRILKITNNRVILIRCFQALMKHGTGVAKELAKGYSIRCDMENMSPSFKEATIDQGIRLGGFLCDAGWFSESAKVLSCCRDLCLSLPDGVDRWIKTLECCQKLLHAEIVYSQIEAATKTKDLAEKLVQQVKDSGLNICFAALYTQFSLYSFYISNYDQAYLWSLKSVQELNVHVSPRVIVDALSMASKACVIRRELTKGGALVRQAVYLARETFGTDHPKYADALLDYGFYLLNSDSMKDSVTVYEQALKLKESIFGDLNLPVAVAHEDLGYALYVHEYSSGRFETARQHVEEAIQIMKALLPKEHLMLASAQRVKALILEEIALDSMPDNLSEQHDKLLAEAEKLHKDALRLARFSFGEDNVQTAKHYGNLGRLYQSMRRFKEAELMHLKSIRIKEKLLGPDDFEVGLSVGHLASLYNYHLREYEKAEKLYFRSININLKLFSPTYSGLEYDYRGLMHVYDALNEAEKMATYVDIMSRWKELRSEHENKVTAPLSFPTAPSSLEELQKILAS